MRAVIAMGVALTLSGCAGVADVVGVLYDGLALGAEAFKGHPSRSVESAGAPAAVDLASVRPK